MSAIQPSPRPRLYLKSTDGIERDLTDIITKSTLNYTMDAGTELKLELTDRDGKMLKSGYFRLQQEFEFFEFTNLPPALRDMGFASIKFTLHVLDIRQGDGTDYSISLTFYDSLFSKLKTDLKPQAYRAANGFSYARNVAKKYGLKFIGEEVKGKQETIKVKAKNNTESVWAVLQRAASDNQFMCFISNKTLFFASPKYLIGRWGIDVIQYKPAGEKKERDFYYIPLVYPTPVDETRYFLTEIPSMRKSLDSPKVAEGNASIMGESAHFLRPGMTVMVYGINEQFNLAYLITSVDYSPESAEPTEINFANVAKLAPDEKKKVDQKISEVTVISGTGK